MRNHLSGYALVCLLLLSGAVAGCVAYREYRQCGYGGCADDARITAAIGARLKEHRELAAPDEVYVQTVGGVVYLTGHVTTDMQRDTAELLARETPGARRVVDTMSVTADYGR